MGQTNQASGETIIYSRPERQHVQGVELLMTPEALIVWEPVSARKLSARFQSKGRNINIIQCYAPTNATEEVEKEEFYSTLQATIDKSHRRDLKILLGDLNAKVGSDNTYKEFIMGNHGIGDINENGALFTDVCDFNDLVI